MICRSYDDALIMLAKGIPFTIAVTNAQKVTISPFFPGIELEQNLRIINCTEIGNPISWRNVEEFEAEKRNEIGGHPGELYTHRCRLSS